MIAMPQEHDIHPADRYTPAKVERILRQFPYMLDRHCYEEVRTPSAKKVSANDWMESRMSERADVEWALFELPLFQYRIVYLTFIGGLQPQEIADIMECTPETVRLNRIDGIRYIAWLLGWRDESLGWGSDRKPKRTRVALLSKWMYLERLSSYPAIGRIASRLESLRE